MTSFRHHGGGLSDTVPVDYVQGELARVRIHHHEDPFREALPEHLQRAVSRCGPAFCRGHGHAHRVPAPGNLVVYTFSVIHADAVDQDGGLPVLRGRYHRLNRKGIQDDVRMRYEPSHAPSFLARTEIPFGVRDDLHSVPVRDALAHLGPGIQQAVSVPQEETLEKEL